ncbi:MAG TPA: hypothetical protein VI653_25040 [Steroidobacteraceae bacterium]
MYALRRYIDQIPQLAEFAYRVAQNPLIQAVYVEPDLLWQAAWQLYRTSSSPDRDLQRAFDKHTDREFAWWRLKAMTQSMEMQVTQLTDPEHDLDWYPDYIRVVLQISHPLWVRVHLCPRPDTYVETKAGARNDINSIAQSFSQFFRITLEDRPLAVLAAQSGDRIHGAGPGTVGGFLQESGTNLIYGVTCSHVASAGLVTDTRGRSLGTVGYATSLNASAHGQLCNPRATGLNDVDAALFLSLGGANPCRYSGPSSLFGSGQTARMTGGYSKGPNSYSLGGIGLVQTLHHNGQNYCFRDLFSFRPQLTSPLPTAAALALAPVPMPGDSGSWITVAGAGTQPDWIGMLVGVDQVEGFAVDATKVMQWMSNQNRRQFSVW